MSRVLLQVPDKNDFRACKRKSLRGGAFARRKFSVNSVRSPRKLSGTIHIGAKYIRDRGAAVVPVMAGGAAVPAMRSRGESVPLIQGRVARLRPRAQPLRLPHDLAKENIFRALLPLVYACQHANWR